MLQQFQAGERHFGFIEGPQGYIVTERDFCHEVLPLNEPAELNIALSFNENYQPFTLEEIRALASPIPSFREWAHYWGIKGRVHTNYRLFLKSMREIGADTSQMPAWGEEIQTAEVCTGRS